MNWCKGTTPMDWIQKKLCIRDGLTWSNSTNLQMEGQANRVLEINNQKQIMHHAWVWSWHTYWDWSLLSKAQLTRKLCPTRSCVQKHANPHHLGELNLCMATMFEAYGCRPKHTTTFQIKMIGLHLPSRMLQIFHSFASNENSRILQSWP